MIRYFVFVLLVFPFSALGDEQEDVSPEISTQTKILRDLGTLDRSKNNVDTIKRIIEMIRFDSRDPFHGGGSTSIESLIPAIDYLLKGYDEKILPMLLDYSFNTENVFLKRRAVYCLEKISELNIQSYLESLLGEGVNTKEVKTLMDSSYDEERKRIDEIEGIIRADLRTGDLAQEEKDALSTEVNALIFGELKFYFPVAAGKYDNLVPEKNNSDD